MLIQENGLGDRERRKKVVRIAGPAAGECEGDGVPGASADGIGGIHPAAGTDGGSGWKTDPGRGSVGAGPSVCEGVAGGTGSGSGEAADATVPVCQRRKLSGADDGTGEGDGPVHPGGKRVGEAAILPSGRADCRHVRQEDPYGGRPLRRLRGASADDTGFEDETVAGGSSGFFLGGGGDRSGMDMCAMTAEVKE